MATADVEPVVSVSPFDLKVHRFDVSLITIDRAPVENV
jgi:hypothetical protein